MGSEKFRILLCLDLTLQIQFWKLAVDNYMSDMFSAINYMWNVVERDNIQQSINSLYSETEMIQSPVTAIPETSLTHGDFIIL